MTFNDPENEDGNYEIDVEEEKGDIDMRKKYSLEMTRKMSRKGE